MNRIYKKWIGGILAGILVISSLTGCRIGNTELVLIQKKTDKKTIFSVNDTKCSIIEAKLYLCNYKNLYGNPFDIDLWENEENGRLEAYVKDVTVSELSRIVCMDLLAEKQNVSLTSEEKKLAEKAAEEYYKTLTSDEIEFIGLTESKLEEFYEHYALAVKLYNTLTVGVDEEVSDDEARVITIQEIYVTSEEKKDEIVKLLDAKELFSIVASTYTELSVVERNVGRGELPLEVEKVAFELNNGAQSSAIEAEDGYYFVYCVNKYDEALTEANKSVILERREKEQFNDLYDAFTAGAEFQFNDELWDSIEIDITKDYKTNSFFTTYDKIFGKTEE